MAEKSTKTPNENSTKSAAVSPTPQEIFLLEQRKVKALEKISNTIDALTLWVEEIDKDVWGPRIEHYLHEWYKASIEPKKLND